MSTQQNPGESPPMLVIASVIYFLMIALLLFGWIITTQSRQIGALKAELKNRPAIEREQDEPVSKERITLPTIVQKEENHD